MLIRLLIHRRVAQGLTFSNLVVSGGALRTEGQWSGSSAVFRPVTVSHVGTLYGSYLVRSGARPGSADPNSDSTEMRVGGAGQSIYYSDFSAGIKGWNAAAGRGYSKVGRLSGNAVNSGVTCDFTNAYDATYLVLFKITNLGVSGSKTIKTWILTPLQFQHFRSGAADSLTEAELDTAPLGVWNGQVLQRGSHTTSLAADLDPTKVVSFRTAKAASIFIWNVDYDEFRLSPVSLDAVTPVQ